ncbi:hypothetical protein KHC28_14355 [Ancylobacter sonchi]|uniref:hypothetical protein n=1 Tax=Ancylobacter sonchi TaxID=1937790 RepID=UPI001BD445BD|nr:hypothetical protein [Ancylobacter sonchi]MBS7534841.1 hypothetical protein [Ancylobacter sonchi]
MKSAILSAALAVFFITPASAEPISLIAITGLSSAVGGAAGVVSSLVTLGIGLGASFIPSRSTHE